MRTVRIIAASLAACLALAGTPVAALAVDELPQEMVDPPAAVPPAEDAAPVEAAPDEPAVDAQGGDAPAIVAGMADAHVAADAPAVVAGAADVPATGPAGVGSLPFTGVDDRQLVLLFLVASLLVCAGTVTRCWSTAARELR